MRSLLLLFALIVSCVTAWVVKVAPPMIHHSSPKQQRMYHPSPPHPSTSSSLTAKNTNVEETTKKYGLEVGLVQSLQSKEDGAESAKTLLKKYGIAYLATSIPLAILSMAFFYILVDQGVNVASLLSKVGLVPTETTEKAGTFAIAYAAHKATSPIRFPPTVLLTPLVAQWIGKEEQEEEETPE